MNTDRSVPPRRLLVVTLADLGDALLTTPALHALRHAFPHTQIDILTTPVGAAALHHASSDQGHPLFDDLILFEKHRFDTLQAMLQLANLRYAWQLWRRLRSGRYDACVLLHHLTTWFGTLKYAALVWASGALQRYGLDNGRGGFLTHAAHSHGFGARHQVEYWQQVVALLGAAPARPTPTFTPTADDHDAAQALLSPIQPLPCGKDLRGTLAPQPLLIALHPGSGAYAPARRWPPQRWAAVADTLIATGSTLVLLGGSEEDSLRRSVLGAMQHAEHVLDLGGRTTLGQLAAILQRCNLFIGNDSGVAHLAGSVGTPTVTVFGPTDPHTWGPYGGEPWQVIDTEPNGVQQLKSGPHRALHAAIACSPCIYRGQQLGTPHGCPDRTCLLRITPQQVVALVHEQLAVLSPTHDLINSR